jgi:hypothetical protein
MFNSPPSATAQHAIDVARRRFRRLSANGIYPGIQNLPQSIVTAQVEAASAFLSLLTPTKTPRVCSYALKHVAERWAGHYVSNGSLIAAAIARGLVVESPPWWSMNPNVAVGVSQKSLKALAARRVTA